MQPKLPPGPRTPSLIQTMGWWTRPIAYAEQCRARYGKKFTIRLLGAPPFVFLTEPDDIKEVFQAPPDVLHPGEGAKVLEPVVGTHSVILLDEDPHLEQRKLMLPAFHGKKVQALESLMTEVTEKELDRWPRDASIELHPRFQALTMEIILRTVFGLEEGARLDSLRRVLTGMLELGSTPGSVVTFLQRDLGPLTPFRRFMQLRDEADELIHDLIDERRAQPSQGDDILSMFLEARHDDGSPMSHQELRDELMTMLTAGHETTASQLAWVFAILPRQPRIMKRLQEEIDSGDGDDYMTATINEVMRTRPVLPNAEPRLTMRPFEVGGWLYPEGVALICNAYLLHHDPDVYDDPYSFRPERFLEEPPGTYTFLPFGGGRRRCIGASFAMFEMKVVIRAILGRADVALGKTGPELARRRSITISPGRGAPTRLTDRVREPVAAA